MTGWVVLVAWAALLGSCLIAGVFLAFSTFVMRALARLPKTYGVEAMNHINVTVITGGFLGPFLGTALLCLALVVCSGAGLMEFGSGLLLAASLLYLFGCFAVTMIFNVPLNDRLARVTGEEQNELWEHYLFRWTLWNHVRTGAAWFAALLFAVGLHQ